MSINPTNEPSAIRPPKTIAVGERDSSYCTPSLVVDQGVVRCELSHPYDGTFTEWECSHEEFLTEPQQAAFARQFSPQAVADALAEIHLRRGLIADAKQGDPPL